MNKITTWMGAAWLAASLPAMAGIPQDLTLLSMQDLLDIQVTSVSRVEEPLSAAAASVQVITADDIAASAVRNLPEALALFNGLTVAQIDGRSWAIAARGFNSSTSDKLEVRLDGRSLYTPLFSGVIWEMLSLPLDRIERIELIRGPGASLWGANAVNGVINIVTKNARSGTHSFVASGGRLKHLVAIRQGEDFGKAGRWELFLRDYEHGSLNREAPTYWEDNLKRSGIGLRVDLEPNQQDRLMVSINAHDSVMGSAQADPGSEETMRGFDAITRWTRQLNADSELEIQLNLDETWRHIPGHFGENRKQADLDLRVRRNFSKHEILLGAGMRHSRDTIDDGRSVFFAPNDTRLNTYNLYLQDRITLSDELQLTLGSKFEDNSYSGVEVQPSVRLSWRHSDNRTLWAAVSRASRTPTRVDRDLGTYSPNGGGIITNDKFDAEQAQFFELGWRAQVNPTLNLDLATWYADYGKLRGLSLLDDGQSLVVGNNGYGRSYGAELDMLWAPSTSWRVWLGYVWQDIVFKAYPDRNDINIEGNNERDPQQQVKLRGFWSINKQWHLGGLFRHVGALKDSATPSYNEVDLKLSYHPRPNVQFSIAGRNLLNHEHPEFNDGSGSLVPQEIYFTLRWDI